MSEGREKSFTGDEETWMASVEEGRAPPRDASAAPSRLIRGQTLGRYVVLSTLGAGGMGVVYGAYDPELDRKVALKVLLTRGPGTQGAGTHGHARLVREAQAMARLTHPNVITVHDVGTYEGQVFVAMEYVDGGTLRDWVEAEKRPWGEVVDLYCRAGRGLAHAHLEGLVHRDFKPENVLIGAGGRIVRVADFGLARRGSEGAEGESLDDSLEDSVDDEEERALIDSLSGDSLNSPLTVTGAAMGTPAYMAPEQHEGRKVDARADQFAFCVALWEALYGQRPFGGETIASLLFTITTGKIVEPPKDTRVPNRIRRVLTRGLSARASRRWPSMQALLEELSRDPRAKRRKIMGWAAGVAAVGITIAVASTTQQNTGPVCADAGAALGEAWSPERREAVREALTEAGGSYGATVASQVERELDAYAEDWTSMHLEACEATHVAGTQSAHLLDVRMLCLDQRRQSLASITEVLSEADAKAAEKAVGVVESLTSVEHCADAERLLARVPPPSTPEAAKQVADLGARVDVAAARTSTGNPKGAVESLQALEPEILAVGYRPLTGEYYRSLGSALDDLDRMDEAREAYHKAMQAAVAGGDDLLLARIAARLVDVAEDAVLSKRWYELALAALEHYGGDDRVHAILLTDWGNHLRDVRKFDEAIAAHTQAMELRRKVAGGKDSMAVADSLFNMSATMWDQQEWLEAKPMMEGAIDIWSGRVGPEHPRTVQAMEGLAVVAWQLGDFESGVEQLERVLELKEKARGKDHPAVATTLANLGGMATKVGQLEKAEAALLRALKIREERDGKDHPNVAQILGNLSQVHREAGDYEQAQEVAARARVIFEAAATEGPTRELSTIYTIEGEILRDAGDLEGGRAKIQQGLDASHQIHKGDHPVHVESLLFLARIDVRLEDARRALAGVEKARGLLDAALVPPQTTAELDFVEAQARWQLGEQRRAVEFAKKARSALSGLEGDHGELEAEIETWLREHSDAAAGALGG